MRGFGAVLAILAFGVSGPAAANDRPDPPIPSAEHGAGIYQARCVLCHGIKGMGEGALPLSLPDYPSTNLLDPKHGAGLDAVREAIVWGGSRSGMHTYMSPWGGELTWQEVESVARFVVHLRSYPEAALAMLERERVEEAPTMNNGRVVFLTRCALCHGRGGEGDGKMARVIKSPPPFDLTASRAPDEYLRMIIGGGGQSVGRSPQMPPWSGELGKVDLESVILYLHTIRD
jgi:cytochrome c oxidase cbb3-type subunit 3